ncbi:hypothetical protein [Arsenophonus apicola]|uniref:Uncharacterized protein n=1 Tax=Arsenophonus apicola TaxID=2879119 RepID=A0ABY8NYC2_9GAMM|nr:hypothetical protein [Arsenophonus apicola]WGO82248.1 hypothetical protein QG404_00375 [Arsenophonus apicola]
MNMRLSLNHFAGLLVGQKFDFRNMRLGIKMVFFCFIGVHQKIFKLLRDSEQGFIGDIFFTKREGKRNVTFLSLIGDLAINHLG